MVKDNRQFQGELLTFPWGGCRPVPIQERFNREEIAQPKSVEADFHIEVETAKVPAVGNNNPANIPVVTFMVVEKVVVHSIPQRNPTKPLLGDALLEGFNDPALTRWSFGDGLHSEN